jgi:diadenosine tetraphosphate (Ap4A) HIT family hydrolase
MFALHPDIEAASEHLADLPLCQARLQNDARFVWIVLVPRVAGASGIEDLTAEDQTALLAEVLAAGRAVRAAAEALGRPVERLNLGVLGNLVPQLHAHVVGRRRDDAAWPGPVWGSAPPLAYEPERLSLAADAARAVLEALTP